MGGISQLSQTVTFSVDTKYNDRIQETFTFEQLGLSVEMSDEKIKKELDKIFESWLWHKLNISYSIVYSKSSD